MMAEQGYCQLCNCPASLEWHQLLGLWICWDCAEEVDEADEVVVIVTQPDDDDDDDDEAC